MIWELIPIQGSPNSPPVMHGRAFQKWAEELVLSMSERSPIYQFAVNFSDNQRREIHQVAQTGKWSGARYANVQHESFGVKGRGCWAVRGLLGRGDGGGGFWEGLQKMIPVPQFGRGGGVCVGWGQGVCMGRRRWG